MKAKRLRQIVDALGQFPFDVRTHCIGLLALVSYCVHQAIFLRFNLAEWDWLAISGFALLLVGLRIAPKIDDLLAHSLRRLHGRGVIACSESEFEQLNKRLAQLRRKRAPIWGLVITLAIVVAFGVAWGKKLIDDPVRLALLAVEALGGYVAGFYLGWMVIHGRLARALKTQGINYSVQPGHPDGAAGWRPLGDFYFRQAMLAGLPAAYLAFWVAFIPHLSSAALFSRYTSWGAAYLILLPIAVLVEVAAFVWPMGSFHREMVRQKRVLAAQADKIARRISTIQAEIRGTTHPEEIEELNARLALDLKLYNELEGLPTWPMSTKIRRRFAVQNLALVALPVLGQLVGDKERWDTLVEALRSLFSGGG